MARHGTAEHGTAWTKLIDFAQTRYYPWCKYSFMIAYAHARPDTLQRLKEVPICVTHTHAHKHAYTQPKKHTQLYLRAHTHLHTHKRAYKHKHAAKIMEKRPPTADDEQQRKGHNHTVIHLNIHKSAREIIKMAVSRWRATAKRTQIHNHSGAHTKPPPEFMRKRYRNEEG